MVSPLPHATWFKEASKKLKSSDGKSISVYEFVVDFSDELRLKSWAKQIISRCKRCYSDTVVSARFIGNVLVAVYVAKHLKDWHLTAARTACASGHPGRTYERKI